MARPIVAFLTDFGSSDHYAGAMKGVVLGVCPDVTLVDIAHDLPAHDVMAGALELAACYRFFPAGTIFLVVVDPGVGSARRGLAVDTGDYRFVAPDNGVLSVVLAEAPPKKVVELTDRKYARPTVSRTFEGRDRFAPAAGWLAKGLALASLGRAVSDYHRLELPPPVATADDLTGEVRRIDRFGNAITNIDRRSFDKFAQEHAVQITVGPHVVDRVVATYDEARGIETCALFGSTDHLEIAVPGGSAAARLGLTRGAAVSVRRVP
ncbi:MAG: SAM-dependent chlorinase/fluorinase [Acidobacteria bacterium]|nr:SAM-dependent chlorinase/fluorinase [Acidobacteriota bacterium]